MADIETISAFCNRLEHIYSNPAFEQIRMMQERMHKLYSDSAFEHLQQIAQSMQEYINNPHFQSVISALENAASQLPVINLSANSIDLCLDMVNQSVQFLQDVENSNDPDNLTLEYISATESSLGDLQSLIPADTEEGRQTHNLIDSIIIRLSSLTLNEIVAIIALFVTIWGNIIGIYQSNQSTIVANDNADRLISALEENSDKIIDSINNLYNQQAAIDAEQNDRLDRLENDTDRSED